MRLPTFCQNIIRGWEPLRGNALAKLQILHGRVLAPLGLKDGVGPGGDHDILKPGGFCAQRNVLRHVLVVPVQQLICNIKVITVI